MTSLSNNDRVWRNIKQAEEFARTSGLLPVTHARAAVRTVVAFSRNQYMTPRILKRETGQGPELELRSTVAYLDNQGYEAILGLGPKSSAFFQVWLDQIDQQDARQRTKKKSSRKAL